jgi:hypothetical protein
MALRHCPKGKTSKFPEYWEQRIISIGQLRSKVKVLSKRKRAKDIAFQ